MPLKSCKVYHTKIKTFKRGRWRYKLIVSLKFAKPTIQRYKIQGWMLALQTYSVRDICSVYHNQGVKVYHTKTVKFKCGRWHHQLRVSLKLPTVPCKDTKIQGWTLATQTYYGVVEFRKVNHTKIQQFKAQGWTLAVLTCKTMFLKSAKSTIQRYKHSSEDVGVTNLQCP